jgi:hypothetical protein
MILGGEILPPKSNMLGKEENNMVKAKVVVEDEKLENFKKQLLAEMAAKIEQFSNSGEKETKDSEDYEGKPIRLDDYIKVMSLCPNELNLSTRKGKGGKIFQFTKLYEVKRIMYQDLVDILETHRNFAEAGFFVILSKDVIRHQGLDDVYANILTKEKMEDILKGNSTDAVNLFKSANESQQEVICRVMVEDLVAGKTMDLNFVDRISRAVGYSLVERAEDIKKSRDIK